MKLSQAFRCADSISIDGYEIDTFDLSEDTCLVGAEDIIQFEFANQEITLDESGEACVTGRARETDLADWEDALPRWLLFQVRRPMTEKDTQ